MMNINDFCRVYNCNKSAVYQKIKRHPELFNGHAEKGRYSKIILLDDTAQELLKPSEQQQEIRRIMRLGKAADENRQSENFIHQAEVNNLQNKISNLVDEKAALTRKQENLEKERQALMQELSHLKQELSERDAEIVQLRATIDEMKKPKGLFHKLKS